VHLGIAFTFLGPGRAGHVNVLQRQPLVRLDQRQQVVPGQHLFHLDQVLNASQLSHFGHFLWVASSFRLNLVYTTRLSHEKNADYEFACKCLVDCSF